MKYRFLTVALSAVVLLISAGLSLAAESSTEAPQKAVTKAEASPKSAKHETDAKHKQSVKIKLVDLNTAKKADLMKLPGISDAEADKIIAARPLGSKAWLVSHGMIPDITYQAVKDKVVCKLTKKDVEILTAKPAQKNKK
jgi:hypothetical protein